MKTEPGDVQAWAEKNGVEPYLGGPPRSTPAPQWLYCSYANVDIGTLSRARAGFYFETGGTNSTLMAIYLRFSSDDYQAVLNAMKAKYGEPDSIDHPAVVNRLGNTFSNEVVTWNCLEGSLVLQRFRTSITEGRLAFLTPVMKEQGDRGGSASKL